MKNRKWNGDFSKFKKKNWGRYRKNRQRRHCSKNKMIPICVTIGVVLSGAIALFPKEAAKKKMFTFFDFGVILFSSYEKQSMEIVGSARLICPNCVVIIITLSMLL